MILAVPLEARFDRSPDGAVWTLAASAHSFWKRYLEVFEGVRVLARVREVREVAAGSVRADGPGVTFHAIPYYHGPVAYALRMRSIARAARAGVEPGDAVILRLGSALAGPLEKLFRDGRPYGVELVGDPWDVFAPGAVRHPLRPFFRRYFARQVRRQCAGAALAAYVTRETLQRRYPCAGGEVGVSDVELPAAAFRPAGGKREAGGALRLVTVGSLEQYYKGTDVLIDAVAACVGEGLDLTLTVVGEGVLRPVFERQARALGACVRFTGSLATGDAVRAELDAADLFVLPSRTEGLPRALLEAMARGLPCIGSAVGGIPELLERGEMVAPGDVSALARCIGEVVRDPGRMAEMSARNLRKAQDYREEVLHPRRQEFYRRVRTATEEWLARGDSPGRPARESKVGP